MKSFRASGRATGRPNPRLASPPHRIRIIGGEWKRTPIVVGDAVGLRPTPDRVRETVFNWITHFKPNFSSLVGLDLFAGTGALGFEFASRGAVQVTLVERAPDAVAAMQALKTKLTAQAVNIVRGDAFAIAASLPATAFDVVFLDPPYDARLLPRLWPAARRLLAPGGLIYAEDAAPLSADSMVSTGLTVVRASRAGAVFFHLLTAD